ncbi:MAG: hypothetical protein F6K55_22435 [Moorea sp. SIO4A3]|nr:hypothetical protein [Moorena sp. SIO4A3]
MYPHPYGVACTCFIEGLTLVPEIDQKTRTTTHGLLTTDNQDNQVDKQVYC